VVKNIVRVPGGTFPMGSAEFHREETRFTR
jgi:hypothetical protein